MKHAFALLITIATVVAVAQPKEFSFKQDYQAKTPAQFTLLAVDSDIKILGSDDEQIKVYYIVRKKNELQNISYEELKAYFTININKLNNGVKITTKPTLKNSNLRWENKYTLDFYVLSPKKSACNLRTVDGNITAKTFKGEQQYKTIDGDLKYSEIIGNVTATTTDGDIESHKVKGNLELKTTDGDIQVNGIIGTVNARTIDGDININVAKGGINISAVDGDVNVGIASFEQAIKIKTTDGDIKTTLPKETGFNLIMKGEDLNAHIKNFTGNIDEDYIEGKVNGGGALIELSSSDGDINLKFAE